MTLLERRATFGLAAIYAVRMFGLFVILPIFSLYTDRLQYSNAMLMGIALGVYGLTQLLLQLPLGILSDRIGRKPLILVGLVLLIMGSIVAAMSDNIYVIILGRALQGAGAIGSTLIALLADTTEEENRLKAMSVIGMTIGASFMAAMMLGSVLNSWVGLSGIFSLTAVLAIVCIVVLAGVVPTPRKLPLCKERGAAWRQFKTVLMMPELLRIDLGIFFLHAILMALFLVIPMMLANTLGLLEAHHWKVYLPILLIAFVVMTPFVIIAETKQRMKPVFLGAIIVLTLTQFGLWRLHGSIAIVSVLLCLFFAAFTLLEAILPSLISKMAPLGSKGTAMGIYSTLQFLGVFLGGSLGGWVARYFGPSGVFVLCGVLGILWTIVASTMQKPLHLRSKVIAIEWLQATSPVHEIQAKLLALPGVVEVLIGVPEKTAYLKVDKHQYSESAVTACLLAYKIQAGL